MSYKPFINALLWNSFNVFLYKIILQTHQVCLFYVISKELFGISGTLFSTLYLLINLTNFGFDYSLFAFHRYYISSKIHFKQLMQQFIIRTSTVLLTTTFLIFLGHHFEYLPQISFMTKYLPTSLIALLSVLFISESMKKSLELFAHLSFLNKTITLIEITTLLTYVSIVWISYAIQGFIDIYTIFIPMCIMSFIELGMVIKRLIIFYKTLPMMQNLSWKPTTKDILKNQALNYINQITKALFSPNFIIIFLAFHLGMIKAGYIKLIIDSIILLYMLLNRAVGIPTGALMSKGSDATNSDFPNFKTSFLKITNNYIQFLYVLVITSCCAILPCFIKQNCFDSTLTLNILFFSFAGFLEYLIITYEKLYLTQGAEGKLASINLLGLVGIMPMLWYSSYLPSSYLLLPFIFIRLCSASLIALVAYKVWHLTPTFQLKMKTFLISILPSIAFLAWHLKT